MTTNSNQFKHVVVAISNGDDVALPIPEDFLKQLGWNDGDEIFFGYDNNGRLVLSNNPPVMDND